MQDIITRKHSLVITAIVVLLSFQGILGLLFSLSRLAGLLAPGGSIIVRGVSIFVGPAGGISLVVALASPIIAWGFWMLKPWAHQRALLIELISLVIGAFELLDPGVNRGVPAARIIIAALILICLYASSGVRTLSRA
jgi:hypothetical protein